MYGQQPAPYRSYTDTSVEETSRTERPRYRSVAAQYSKRLVQQRMSHAMPTRDPPAAGVGRHMRRGCSLVWGASESLG
jgi:hypothetical protein